MMDENWEDCEDDEEDYALEEDSSSLKTRMLLLFVLG